MSLKSRQTRGVQSQGIVAGFWRDHGFPFAQSNQSGQPGSDVLNCHDIDVEVFARRDGLAAVLMKLRQALQRPARFHFVVMRPDGYGEAKIAEWPVIMTHKQALELIRLAGLSEADWTEEAS